MLLLLLPTLAGGGCGEEEKRYVANAGASTPTMATHDVQTFISDSGYTRYHLATPAWYVYDDTAEPFWRFPEGVELEQYDNYMRVASTVVCDSAIYYSRKRLWQLDGNVVMVSTEGDSFLTEQLFWEQETRRIRSDSFIHIVRSDRILEGYGFESDQGMADYLIHHPTAILPSERPGGQSRDSSRTENRDSVRGASVRPSERQPRPVAVEKEEAPKPKEGKPGRLTEKVQLGTGGPRAAKEQKLRKN
ncbi:MAG: LPS export ABC transporter periplasmic protein LptC [Muribaculaceae bacterium]|nr:LPS export ABC transporter periplasmic protein LptC [Muribaculaceae bacterium]